MNMLMIQVVHAFEDSLNFHKLTKSTNHESNVAVLISTSTFFHNYRHTVNTLSLYQALKKHGGYTDENILLFLGDEVACNDRNPFKNRVFPYANHVENIYEEFHTSTFVRDDSHGHGHNQGEGYGDTNAEGTNGNNENETKNTFQQFQQEQFQTYYNDNIQVDYSGTDVTVENFFRVLLGRHDANTPPNQKIPNENTNNSKTNLLLYMTGHGGDNFFKFRDIFFRKSPFCPFA